MTVPGPVTSIIGVLILVCQAIPYVAPGAEAFCDKITNDLIGIGFLKTTEGPLFTRSPLLTK